MLQINDVLSNIKDVMEYSIEYIEKPNNLKYAQPLSSFSTNGLYNIKSISISKKDISKFNNYINSIKTAIENENLDVWLDITFKVKISIEFSDGNISNEENLEYDITTSNDTIVIDRKKISEKINILRSGYDGIITSSDSFDIFITIYDESFNEHFITLYSSCLDSSGYAQNPLISINNKAGYIRITGNDYENSISNTKCLKIGNHHGNNSYVNSFNIGNCTNKDSEDYDFNILFATVDCRVTYFGNTYPSGIPQKYSDRLPLARLYQYPMHLNVSTSGLLYENTDEIMESIQTLAIYHVVTNSSGNSRNALSEFERSMHYKNGEVTIDKWVHLNTYDTDGNSYSFSGNSFNQK